MSAALRGWLLGVLCWAGVAGAAPITGFNQNWSYFPALDTPGMLDAIHALQPQMLRYPGGTVTHSWDWRAGQRTHRPFGEHHPLSDVGVLARASGARMIFVLDVVKRPLADQIEMLRALRASGVAVDYVELGNELYAREPGYEARFPGGADYAALVNEWTPALRQAFPGVKVGAVLLGREVRGGNARLAQWNAAVLGQVKVALDAWIFHVYIAEGEDFATTRERFERVLQAAALGRTPLWVTEYGNQNAATHPGYLQDLAALADYLEARADVQIALNHQIVGSQKTKLGKDGTHFTEEGQLFLERARRRSAAASGKPR